MVLLAESWATQCGCSWQKLTLTYLRAYEGDSSLRNAQSLRALESLGRALRRSYCYAQLVGTEHGIKQSFGKLLTHPHGLPP